MTCHCIAKINSIIKERGYRLSSFDPKIQAQSVFRNRMRIMVEPIEDEMVTPPFSLFCTFCPLCGKRCQTLPRDTMTPKDRKRSREVYEKGKKLRSERAVISRNDRKETGKS